MSHSEENRTPAEPRGRKAPVGRRNWVRAAGAAFSQQGSGEVLLAPTAVAAESIFNPGGKASGRLWQETRERERMRCLEGMPQSACYMPGWQFWGAHNDRESLIQKEANAHEGEATDPFTPTLSRLCQSISTLPKAPCHLAGHCSH